VRASAVGFYRETRLLDMRGDDRPIVACPRGSDCLRHDCVVETLNFYMRRDEIRFVF
jgi:hypothetical protein